MIHSPYNIKRISRLRW
jgi:hypothetical protein